MPDAIPAAAGSERSPRPPEPSFEALAKAVDDAAAEVGALEGTPRKAAEELRAAIEAAHRAGLVTIVRTLRADEAGRALLFALVDDPLIRMLFSLHGIIRTGPPAGVGAAGEHNGGGRTGREHAAREHRAHDHGGGEHGGGEHGADGQSGCASASGCGSAQGAGDGCGCGRGRDDPGASQLHGPPDQSRAIIPLSAIRRPEPLDIWPGGAA
jgi:hypothetical protein